MVKRMPRHPSKTVFFADFKRVIKNGVASAASAETETATL